MSQCGSIRYSFYPTMSDRQRTPAGRDLQRQSNHPTGRSKQCRGERFVSLFSMRVSETAENVRPSRRYGQVIFPPQIQSSLELRLFRTNPRPLMVRTGRDGRDEEAKIFRVVRNQEKLYVEFRHGTERIRLVGRIRTSPSLRRLSSRLLGSARFVPVL